MDAIVVCVYLYMTLCVSYNSFFLLLMRKPCRNLTDDDISIKICYMLSEKLYLTMIIYRYSILKGFVTCYYCKNVITVFYSVVFTPPCPGVFLA